MNTIKNIFSTLLIFFIFTTYIFSQSIAEGSYERNKKDRPGIRATLPFQVDQVREAFENYLDDEFNIDLKGNGMFNVKDELYAEEVDAKLISDKRFNLYAQIIEHPEIEDQTQITLFGALGLDVYFNPTDYSKSFDALRTILSSFLKAYLPKAFEERIALTNKELEKIKANIESLNKDIKSKNKKIEKIEKEIVEEQKTIQEQEKKKAEMSTLLNAQNRNFKQAKKRLKDI